MIFPYEERHSGKGAHGRGVNGAVIDALVPQPGQGRCWDRPTKGAWRTKPDIIRQN
jgi:hypothetical protein